ncbi:unnamed protein product [Sympodiomycopsis kandeliae]
MFSTTEVLGDSGMQSTNSETNRVTIIDAASPQGKAVVEILLRHNCETKARLRNKIAARTLNAQREEEQRQKDVLAGKLDPKKAAADRAASPNPHSALDTPSVISISATSNLSGSTQEHNTYFNNANAKAKAKQTKKDEDKDASCAVVDDDTVNVKHTGTQPHQLNPFPLHSQTSASRFIERLPPSLCSPVTSNFISNVPNDSTTSTVLVDSDGIVRPVGLQSIALNIVDKIKNSPSQSFSRFSDSVPRVAKTNRSNSERSAKTRAPTPSGMTGSRSAPSVLSREISSDMHPEEQAAAAAAAAAAADDDDDNNGVKALSSAEILKTNSSSSTATTSTNGSTSTFASATTTSTTSSAGTDQSTKSNALAKISHHPSASASNIDTNASPDQEAAEGEGLEGLDGVASEAAEVRKIEYRAAIGFTKRLEVDVVIEYHQPWKVEALFNSTTSKEEILEFQHYIRTEIDKSYRDVQPLVCRTVDMDDSKDLDEKLRGAGGVFCGVFDGRGLPTADCVPVSQRIIDSCHRVGVEHFVTCVIADHDPPSEHPVPQSMLDSREIIDYLQLKTNVIYEPEPDAPETVHEMRVRQARESAAQCVDEDSAVPPDVSGKDKGFASSSSSSSGAPLLAIEAAPAAPKEPRLRPRLQGHQSKWFDHCTILTMAIPFEVYHEEAIFRFEPKPGNGYVLNSLIPPDEWFPFSSNRDVGPFTLEAFLDPELRDRNRISLVSDFTCLRQAAHQAAQIIYHSYQKVVCPTPNLSTVERFLGAEVTEWYRERKLEQVHDLMSWWIKTKAAKAFWEADAPLPGHSRMSAWRHFIFLHVNEVLPGWKNIDSHWNSASVSGNTYRFDEETPTFGYHRPDKRGNAETAANVNAQANGGTGYPISHSLQGDFANLGSHS